MATSGDAPNNERVERVLFLLNNIPIIKTTATISKNVTRNLIHLPFGVNGLTLATFARLAADEYALATAHGLSDSRRWWLFLVTTGVVQHVADDFCRMVFGVSGLSNKRNALTRL